jgi:hypothetical protein
MIAICPAGPPKLMKPSFSQKRSASPNVASPRPAPRVAFLVAAHLARHHA